MEDEINIVDYLRVVNKRKWVILIFIVAGAATMFFQTLSAPKLYKAEVTFLSLGSNIGNLSQAFSSLGLGGGGQGEGANIDTILKSRTLSRMVAQHEGLKKIVFKELWDAQNNRWLDREPTLDEAASAVSGGISEGSQTHIEVVWNNAETAANIANTYAIELIRFLNQKSIGVNLQILDEAQPPKAPFNKKSNLSAFIGGIFGLFIGLFLTFSLEYWLNIKK
ncbi:hypothetical protein HZC34_07710 [Candidatus Saganbacteria bacterium]|nr:hypothetical protein [Candidatus Saganbacteria bacterium]